MCLWKDEADAEMEALSDWRDGAPTAQLQRPHLACTQDVTCVACVCVGARARRELCRVCGGWRRRRGGVAEGWRRRGAGEALTCSSHLLLAPASSIRGPSADCKGEDNMSKGSWEDALFELADMWTE